MSDIRPVSVKIDVKKIDKNRLYVGDKGTYLDVTLIPSKNDRYGNHYMVVQSVSKEERERGEKGPILGSAKILGHSGFQSAPEQQRRREVEPDDPDSVPF